MRPWLEGGRQQHQAADVQTSEAGIWLPLLANEIKVGTRLEACQYASHVLQVLMEP